MTNINMIMSMTAQTSIHAGAGQALSVIDLPIQRESHTQHPVIFGSSLKGALRSRANQVISKDENDEKPKLTTVFGPSTQGAENNAHAGAIMVSDAKLLLLPVRSLNGYFKWVSCPALLHRYLKDCQRVGIATNGLTLVDPTNDVDLTKLDKQTVAVANAKDSLKTLFLEEFALTAKETTPLIAWAEHFAQNNQLDINAVKQQLAIVNDDMFSYLAQNCTPVNAHIALDENKTTIPGALWYEETLPPETVMYSLIMCTNSRSKVQMTAKEVAQVLTNDVMPITNRYLQVGGNETVGMGWFAVNFLMVSTVKQTAEGES